MSSIFVAHRSLFSVPEDLVQRKIIIRLHTREDIFNRSLARPIESRSDWKKRKILFGFLLTKDLAQNRFEWKNLEVMRNILLGLLFLKEANPRRSVLRSLEELIENFHWKIFSQSRQFRHSENMHSFVKHRHLPKPAYHKRSKWN